MTANAESAESATAAPTPTARLYVKTIPHGAEVTLDGMQLGPGNGLFLVPAGTGRVNVQFDGQGPQVQQVEITEGRITRVEIQAVGAGIDPAVAAPMNPLFGQAGTPVALEIRSSRKLESPPALLTKFDEILEKPLDFEVHESPLRDVTRLIGEKAGLPISLDQKALEEEGVDLDMPITASAYFLSLARDLDILCRPIDLAWTIEDDGIRITTAARSQEDPVNHIHEVSDLTEDGLEALAMIAQSVEPSSWNSVGGAGSIRPDSSDAGTFLVVSQPLGVQRQVRGLLDCLRRMKAMPPDQRGPLAADGYWSRGEPAARVRKALEAPFLVASFEETPLHDALRVISDVVTLPIAIDFRALADLGVDLDASITIASTTLPLGRLLDRLLSPLGLAYVVIDDQLTVTTRDRATEIMSVAIYPVHTLVGIGEKSRSFQSLIDLVQSTVEPMTWNTVGGAASILPVAGDVPCLVVSQTTAGHRAVDAFLKSLR